MPPIAGALNAAMVLRDVSIRNMDFDQFQDVVRPKVLGSFHLDSIFHDVDLDFFVLISSINCVIGNVGQANYAAANMGMCGVAANRRKRGLRSSVANVGAIIGVGYITQSDRDRQLDNTVAKTAMIHLSEEDFHQIFVEAMEAGHLDSDAGPEISTGLHNIVPGDLDAENMPKWFSDPKFSRFIIHRSTNKDDRKKDQVGGASLPERLQACTSQPEVVKVVQEAFGAQLRKILQTSLPDEELMTMRSVDLGLDSLISVDIRSWFAKNLRVSIPVLKIMANDAQMSSLTNLAVEGLPADFTPLVGGEQGSNSTTSPSSSTDEATSTPQQTSTSPSSVAGDASPSSSHIDWDAETCPPQFSQGLESPRNAPRDPPRVVLLTGSSGLLGHHLLDSLLAQPGIDKVICAAVRQLGSRLQAKQLPAPSNRVVYYEGDLTQPNIGLAESDAEDIFREVDAVVHNGSDTSHLKYYTALRDANVGSTKQILQLCHPRKVPVHYVSSAGVALVAGLEAFPEISCTTTGKQPPADGSHGYMCGKWVCESMLERVHSNHPDWKVVIQRPSTIIREGSDAAVARAEFDWVNALLHYSHKIKAVPRVDHNKGTFDLVSVQTVCKDIVRELLTPTKKGSDDITYVNNVGDVVIPMGRMNEIGNQKGYDGLYSVLPMEEWAVRAIEAGLHPAVAALIETFDEAGVARYPQLLRERRD
jgi:thioester reductase-like protein